MAQISAAEAQQIIAQEQRQLNQTFKLPKTLDRIRVMMEKEVTFIANVGPWPRMLETGSLKNYFIQAYDPKKDPEKKGYVKGPNIPLIVRQAYVANADNMGYFEDDGMQVAQEGIGIGFGLHPMNSITREGFFVPAGPEPAAEEVERARRALNAYLDELIAEARDAYDKGPEERKAVIQDRHLYAGRAKGIDEPWLHHKHTQESVKCEMCGKYNPAGIAKCACGTIIDFDLYQKIEAKQKAMLETKPGAFIPPLKK